MRMPCSIKRTVLLGIVALGPAGSAEAQLPWGAGGDGLTPPTRVALAATFGSVVIASALEPSEDVFYALTGSGLLLSPVAGYAYARDLGGAIPGLSMRSGGIVVSYFYLEGLKRKVDDQGLSGLPVVILGSVPLIAGWTVLLASDLHRLSRRWRSRTAFEIAPWVGGRGGGLQVLVRW